jgi:uncharacterized heparinase superfamily protein
MSTGEIAWRTVSAAERRLSRTSNDASAVRAADDRCDWSAALANFRCSTDRPVFLDGERARRVATALPRSRDQVIAAADLAMDLKFTYFGYEEAALPRPVDWNVDPLHGVRWPDVASSKLEYRTHEGDVKWIWELNRLQHLPWLAQAWLVTGADRYSTAAFEQLDSWMDQNPPGRGIAWRGAFEIGIRAISIALSLQGFRESPDLTVERYRRIVRLLGEGAARCWKERSRFSSANNHLVGELAGFAVVALLFPELPEAAEWERQAVQSLIVEADRQILPDGAGAEQAVGYQVFTSELMMVVAALLVERDGHAPAPIVAAIGRSATFLSALAGPAGPEPRYGDDDNGFAVRLGVEPRRTVRDHLAAASAVTGGDGTSASWTAAWFEAVCRARSSVADFDTALETLGDNHFAPDGGLVALRAGSRTALMDVGPLGYLSIAAHGHADALAVTISVDGQDVIGDPGAGSYYGHPNWRRIHRSTRAHATVEVDGQDQSLTGGPFLWTTHAEVVVHAVDLASGIVDAEHLGYRRLANPVNHRRWLAASPSTESILVVDLVSGPGRHAVRTSWPLHPSLTAVAEPCGHLVLRDGTPIAQIVTAATVHVDIDHLRGEETTHLGWWSDRLESRMPAWLIGAHCLADLPVAVATIVSPTDHAGRIDALTVRHDGAVIHVAWTDSGIRRGSTIDTTLFGAVTWHEIA